MLYFVQNVQQAKFLSKQYKKNAVRRIYHRIYTDDLESPFESIVLSNWMEIIPHIVKQGILSYRTAVDLKPLPFREKSIVFITSSYVKTIQLPGLIVKVYKGDTENFTEQVLPRLSRSNEARRLLENLSVVRGAGYLDTKTVGRSGVERLLTKELGYRGEANLNRLRDEAKQVAAKLNYHAEFDKLNQIISALLSTHDAKNILITPYAKAMAQKNPYDEDRIKLFDNLIFYLKRCHFLQRSYQYEKTAFKNLSFYEAYFSNYIEGTKFIIDEAENIIFKGQEVKNRHADSHDVLANFALANDYSEMSMTPSNQTEFIEILQNRHALLMKERPEKNPGQFKEKPNNAGNTLFVDPKAVLGTLFQGFERYQQLTSGIEKALFMHFLISEVHPFQDGNGRLSRLMLNAELVNADSCKIIIPTVYRDNYLNGLRLASRDGNFRTYVKVMDQAQAYTASIPWKDYGEAREKIETDNANISSDEGIPIFNRVLRQLKLSDFPI